MQHLFTDATRFAFNANKKCFKCDLSVQIMVGATASVLCWLLLNVSTLGLFVKVGYPNGEGAEEC